MTNIPDSEIWFYSDKERPYGVFSNFYKCNIEVGGIVYPNSEAYFQAEKFRGRDATDAELEYASLIGKQSTGNKSAILARQRKPVQNYKWAQDLWTVIQEYRDRQVSIRKDWDVVRDNVMRRIVYMKFAQNPNLKKLILETGDKLLFEHTHRDAYWGDGHPRGDASIHGNGKNMLGRILEEVRYLLGRGVENIEHLRYPVTFEYSNWVIPGIFLMSGALRKKQYREHKKQGFRYFASLMKEEQEIEKGIDYREEIKITGDFCIVIENVILARWSMADCKIATDKKALEIALTVINAIGRGLPVVLHCFEETECVGMITAIVLGLMYQMSDTDALKITDTLFRTRKNLERGTERIPRVSRIMSLILAKQYYNNFY